MIHTFFVYPVLTLADDVGWVVSVCGALMVSSGLSSFVC